MQVDSVDIIMERSYQDRLSAEKLKIGELENHLSRLIALEEGVRPEEVTLKYIERKRRETMGDVRYFGIGFKRQMTQREINEIEYDVLEWLKERREVAAA